MKNAQHFRMVINDDYVDSMSQAIMRLRGGYFITHPEDYKDEKIERVGLNYYG